MQQSGEKPTRKDEALWSQRLLAGGMAGIVSRTVTSPTERIKWQRQVSKRAASVSARRLFARSVQREGWLSALWRGNGTNCMKVFPATAIRFCVFEECRDLARRRNLDTNYWAAYMGCGAVAGVAALAASYPLDVLRARLSVSERNTSVQQTVCNMVRDEGARSLYRGLLTSMVRVVPFGAINFATYETLRARAVDQYRVQPGAPTSTLMGALSGCTAMTIMYPVDVVRHRMMVQERQQQRHRQERKQEKRAFRRGGLQTALHMMHYEGWLSFYRGLLISYAKVAPTVACTWTIYEWFRKQWQ